MSDRVLQGRARSKGSFAGRLPAILGIVLCLGWIPLLLAQLTNFEGKTIREIRYEPEKQPLAPGDLTRAQLLQTGSALRSSDVAQTIDRMFATGRYEDIQVHAEDQGNGLVIRFVTRPARFFGNVRVNGKIAAPPNHGNIVNAAKLALGTPFRAELLDTAQASVEQLFKSNGLYDSTVKVETTEDPDTQQMNVTIDVAPGKRARYEPPVIRGDTKLSDSTIIRATGWRVPFIGRWRQVTQQLTGKGVNGIERKYQSQDRLAATVDLKSLDYDSETRRAKPTLEINAGPKIQIKAVETKVSKRLLKRYVPIYEEGTVDRDLLVEGARNLRDHFQAAGYADVDVTFSELPVPGDERTIQFFISRGPRRRLVHIEIQGNKYFDTDAIRERMILQPSSFRLRRGRYSEVFRHKDEQSIATLYKDNGFRNVKVTSTVQNDYRGKTNDIAAMLSIEEGPQWTVAHIELKTEQEQEPQIQMNKEAVLARLASAEGQPYSDYSVAADRAEILTLCYSHGFRHAKFHWTALPAGDPHRVNLEYTVQVGEHESVRDVLVSGLKATRPAFLKRNLPIDKGDPLSFSEIRQSQRDLYDLGVFAKVDTAVQNSDGMESEKYVLYDIEEAHRYNVTVGVGAELARLGGTATSVNSPSAGTGFTPRVSVNLSRLNMFGIGHTMTVQAVLSTLNQKLAVNYVDPRFLNVKNRTLTFTTLYDLSRDVRTFSSRREEASIQVAQKLSKPTTVSFRFAYRRVSVNNVVIPDLLVPQLLQPVRIGILSGNWVQDRRDNAGDAHTGMYNTVDAGAASSIFGSQRNFARFLARNATYYRIGKELVLARQLTVGAILPFSTPAGVTSSDAIPLPERLFGGGSLSHRGFPENQAGPRDIGTPAGPGGVATQPTGFPLGGNAQLFSNIELRFPLLGDNIGGVLFHDAGNVYSSVSNISVRFHQRDAQDFNYMVHAAGFGIRYKTPVGPVRFDLAYSINPPRYSGFKGTLQDLLNCNPNLPPDRLPSVCQSVAQRVSHFQFFFSIGQTF